MKRADVLIVGAGPSGLMAAIHLSNAGFNVAIFEKEIFPHIKTCGDMVTLEGLDLLKSVGLNRWLTGFRRVDTLRLSSPNGQIIDIPACDSTSEANIRMIPREYLDAKLAETAVNAGVLLYQGERVLNAAIDSAKGVQINTRTGTYQGEILLLADGSHAPITRKLGLLQEPPDLIAARQYLTAPQVNPEGPLELHFQKNVIPGYTWLFPEGNGVINLGCGTYTRYVSSKKIDLFNVIETFKRNDPILVNRLKNAKPLGPIKTHPLRTHLGGTLTHGDRFLVLGDAAGLISPLTGEGITSGMLSGTLAAQFVSSAFAVGDFSAKQLVPYTKKLKEHFGRNRRAAQILRRVMLQPHFLNHFFKLFVKLMIWQNSLS